MSKFSKLLSLCIFIFTSSQAFAGGAHLVITLDAKGDVALNKKYNELAEKLVPENHPTVRIIRVAHGWEATGVLWQVVEFDDLADMDRIMAVLESSKEANALQKKLDRKGPMLSSIIGDQIYYNEES